MRQHRLTLALLISLLLHLVAMGAPGWRVPTLNDWLPQEEIRPSHMDARLVAPAAELSPAVAARRVAGVPQAPLKPVPVRRVVAVASPSPVPAGVLALPPESSTVDAAAEPSFNPAVEAGASLAADEVLAFAEPGRATAAAPVADAGTDMNADTDTDAARSAVASPRFQLPRRGHVRFNVTRGEQGFVVGQSVHHWNHDNKSYVLNSVTETTGLIALFRSVRVVWLSQGEIGRDGLRPHEFRTEREGVRGDSASFDWPALKLGLSGGVLREQPLPPGTQDVLSMFYELGHWLPVWSREAGTGKPNSNSLYVTTGRKLERYRFEILGDETLTLRQRGRQRALHVRTLAGEQTIDIWLAYDLRGLPLRIRYTDGKGESYDQLADEIEFDDMTAPTQPLK
ncbi:MAG: DUF3108 domain-containing protein [Sterolibacterium sp.]|nr:DUF3108 domain-containing protein [Sterolibacterium sp.]